MSEKPLDVRVAEALTGTQAVLWHWSEKYQKPVLGPNPTGKTPGAWALPVCVRDPGFFVEGYPGMLFDAPSYHDDWASTGPLILRYGISLALHHRPPTEWVAFVNTIGLAWGEDCFGLDGYADDFEYGPTPLVAVCNLILSLKAAGKLEPAA
jgi:hypothetical protein